MFGFPKKISGPFFSAVIVASDIFPQKNTGQQAPFDEFSVVIRSVSAYEACSRIREIVLVCPEADIPEYYALVQDYRLDKVSSVVGGGPDRQDSVFRGIEACGKEAAYYVIHDGARPLVAPQVIDCCIDAALQHGAAAAGVPVMDTIKVHDEAGFIVNTPNRSQLAAIQTPQIFEAPLYRRAMEMARRSGRTFSDDCQMVEASGKQVYISQGSFDNIRITTSEDFILADAILTNREKETSAWL